MENWNTILTVSYPHELIVIRGRLEAEGIPCFIQNEFVVQVNPFLSNAVGGVQLQVRDEDLTKALALLVEHNLDPGHSDDSLA